MVLNKKMVPNFLKKIKIICAQVEIIAGAQT
jgi:hypothetical protein